MIDDNNKTSLTKDVTSAAIAYLDERGCKPIETEVQVEPGWVADVASVVAPTQTELIDLKLIGRAPKWSDPGRQEWTASVQRLQKLMTVLVEVKTSRGDFCGDKKWAMQPPVNLAYIAFPKGLKLPESDLPAGWGLLEVNDTSVRLQRVPEIRTASIEQQLSVVLQIAVRRDHDTRYERLRRLRREEREYRGAQSSITRIVAAMQAMESIVNGEHESVQKALEYHGIKNLPGYYTPSLEKLWSVASR